MDLTVRLRNERLAQPAFRQNGEGVVAYLSEHVRRPHNGGYCLMAGGRSRTEAAQNLQERVDAVYRAIEAKDR